MRTTPTQACRPSSSFVVAIVSVMLAQSAATLSADVVDQGRVIQPQSSAANPLNPVVTALRIHPNGRWMVTAGDDHAVRIWDIKSGEQLKILEGHRDWVDTATFSPDGKWLATAGHDHRMLLWNLFDGTRRTVLTASDQAISAIAFNRGGDKLAIVGFDRVIWIYDVLSQEIVRELAAPCQDMRCVTFSNDDRLLAGGGRNGRIAVYEVETGSQLSLFRAHGQRIRAITFSTNDEQFFTAGEDRVIRSWNSATFERQFEIYTGKSKPMSMVWLGRDRLATGGSDNCISIWNTANGKRERLLKGHTGSVVALDQKDGMLVSGSFDTTVRVWSLRRDKEVVSRDVRKTR